MQRNPSPGLQGDCVGPAAAPQSQTALCLLHLCALYLQWGCSLQKSSRDCSDSATSRMPHSVLCLPTLWEAAKPPKLQGTFPREDTLDQSLPAGLLLHQERKSWELLQCKELFLSMKPEKFSSCMLPIGVLDTHQHREAPKGY